MKILVTLTYYYPHWTGLTAYAQRLAEGLAKRGHEITVLTSQFKPQLARDEMHNGVRILRLPTPMHMSRGVIMPGFIPALRKLAQEHDLIQVHTPMLETIVEHNGVDPLPLGRREQLEQAIQTIGLGDDGTVQVDSPSFLGSVITYWRTQKR